MTGDEAKHRPDVPFIPAGVGMDHRRNCMGCKQWRQTLGGRGVGVLWRCSVCLAKKEAQAA